MAIEDFQRWLGNVTTAAAQMQPNVGGGEQMIVPIASTETRHVVHHTEPVPPSIQIKVAQTTRGATYELNAHAGSVAEAMALIEDAERQLRARYGASLGAA